MNSFEAQNGSGCILIDAILGVVVIALVMLCMASAYYLGGL